MIIDLSFAEHTSRKVLCALCAVSIQFVHHTKRHSELLQGALTLTITIAHLFDHTSLVNLYWKYLVAAGCFVMIFMVYVAVAKRHCSHLTSFFVVWQPSSL